MHNEQNEIIERAERLVLNTEQVASVLGVSKAYLARLRVTGGGPGYVKVGRRVLYPVREVGLWLNAQGRRRSTSDVPTLDVDRK